MPHSDVNLERKADCDESNNEGCTALKNPHIKSNYIGTKKASYVFVKERTSKLQESPRSSN